MSDYSTRIRGWSKAHPTKTATVEDILALRSNIVANLETFAKGAEERLKRAESAITELDADMKHNVQVEDDNSLASAQADSNILEEVWRLAARVEELERRMFSARVARMWWRVKGSTWDRMVGAMWRLRLRFHREEETTTEAES